MSCRIVKRQTVKRLEIQLLIHSLLIKTKPEEGILHFQGAFVIQLSSTDTAVTRRTETGLGCR